MSVSRKKMLVWPPLSKADYGGLSATKAYVAWFAGHLAEQIVIPVLADAQEGPELPAYVSAAALSDLPRVKVVVCEKPSAALFADIDVVLVRRRDLSGSAPPVPLRKFRGSEKVVGLTEDSNPKSAAPSYYFVGAPESDKQDAYYAVCFTYWFCGGVDEPLLKASQARLNELRQEAARYDSVAVFGTGPSLAESVERDHSKSFNIICNTIVKNRDFLRRLRPKIIVASDAHFHFSFHRYSASFLSDLLAALESGDASFFTFDKFAAFIRRRVPELADRSFGIPAGRPVYGFDLDKDFRVYPGESVLNMFLLPIASFLSDRVALHGFTGRAPTDAYFWSHSELHQYVDKMEDVRLAHPAFFANRDYPGYAESVDKMILERVVAARAANKSVTSGTTSFYSAFRA